MENPNLHGEIKIPLSALLQRFITSVPFLPQCKGVANATENKFYPQFDTLSALHFCEATYFKWTHSV